MKAASASRWAWLAACGVVALVLGRALSYPFVAWDDPQYIQHNPLVDPHVPWPADGFLTAALGYPIPVTIGLYRLVATLTGLQPAAFHALNLLLHAANVALFWHVLRASGLVRGAWLGAVLWAVHPLVVEPVTWCTGTKDLLYAMGLLLVLLAVLRPTRLPPWLLLVLLAAMLAKPTAIVLPAVLLWTLWALDGPAGVRRPGAVLAVAVGSVLAVLVFLAGLALADLAGPDGYQSIDSTPGSGLERLAAVLQALDLQARHVVWPVGLLPQYFRLTDLQPLDPPFVRGLVAVALLAGLAVVLWRHADRRLRWWLGVAALAYAPVSMLVPIQRFTCDSYAYVPLLGVCGLVATAAEPYLTRRSVVGTSAVVVVALAGLSVVQQAMWQDSLTLWGTALEADPERPLLLKRYAESLDGLDRRHDAYAFLRSHLKPLQRGRAVDGMVLAVFASAAPVDEARALFAWAYANEPNLRPDAHRNFCTFVAQRKWPLDATERQNLGRALDELRRYHVRRGEVGPLLALAGLAADQQIWSSAGELLEQAFAMSHDAHHAEAAMAAYGAAGPADPRAVAGRSRLARVLPTLATPGAVR